MTTLDVLFLGAILTVCGIPLAYWLGNASYRKIEEREAPRPPRRWWVPIALGVSMVLVIHQIQATFEHSDTGSRVLTLGMYAVVIACVVMAAVDLDVHRLPDKMMFPAMGTLLTALLLFAVLDGAWDTLGRALVTSLAAGALYFVIALLSMLRGSLAIGLGDIKLAVLLGGALGTFGWTHALSGIYAGFLVGGLWALALLALRKVGRKGEFAYGPAMMVGALLGLVVAG